MKTRQQLPLTVIFTTFNEAANIGAAIESVYDWASEIIVVDSFSTDDTEGVVGRFASVQFLQRQYLGPSFQKNWAIPLANHEWVLLMDADERITIYLRDEIEAILLPDTEGVQKAAHFDCFWIGFTHFFMEKKVRYSGWQNDKTIRLIRGEKCRYNNNRVHEEIMTEGLRIGFLKHKFDHYTFKSLDHFLAKQMRYAAWSADDYDNKTGKITIFHLVFKPAFRFFKHFILKKRLSRRLRWFCDKRSCSLERFYALQFFD